MNILIKTGKNKMADCKEICKVSIHRVIYRQNAQIADVLYNKNITGSSEKKNHGF